MPSPPPAQLGHARLARARGRVEAARGRPDRAAEAFERALDAAGRVELPFERAKAGWTAAFPHPLVPSAVYDALGPSGVTVNVVGRP